MVKYEVTNCVGVKYLCDDEACCGEDIHRMDGPAYMYEDTYGKINLLFYIHGVEYSQKSYYDIASSRDEVDTYFPDDTVFGRIGKSYKGSYK